MKICFQTKSLTLDKDAKLPLLQRVQNQNKNAKLPFLQRMQT